MALPFPSNPASQARRDLGNTRASGGLLTRPGLKPVAAPPSPAPVSSAPMAGRMSAPTGRPADANPSMVNPALSPANPGMAPVAPTPVPSVPPPAPAQASATPGASVTSFGPGNNLLSSQIAPGASAVNRTQLAQNTLKDWDAQNAPALAAGFRNVGQQAAKFGRIGAGMTTNDLTGLENTYQRDRMQKSNELASGLASDTIGDERMNRAELRGERGYQTDRSDKAQQDAINQKVLEDQLLNSRYGRAQGLLSAGYAEDPGAALSGAATNYGNQASGALSGGVDLLKSRQPQPAGPDYTALLEQLIKQQRGG